MTHPDARLAALLGGELSPEEEREIRRHLEGCDACRREFTGLESLWGVLGETGHALARTGEHASVWPGVQRGIRDDGWFGALPLPGRVSLAAAAALVGVLLGGLLPLSGGRDRSGSDPGSTWVTAANWMSDVEDYGLASVWLAVEPETDGEAP